MLGGMGEVYYLVTRQRRRDEVACGIRLMPRKEVRRLTELEKVINDLEQRLAHMEEKRSAHMEQQERKRAQKAPSPELDRRTTSDPILSISEDEIAELFSVRSNSERSAPRRQDSARRHRRKE